VSKTVIIGAVAAGMSAATRLRRLDESAEIVVLEAGDHVSFANCGLPYYVGGVIEDRESLLLQTPAGLAARFALDVRTRSRAVAIDAEARHVRVAAPDGTEYIETYDTLILATGARPFLPEIPGAARAFTLRDVTDVDRIAEAVKGAKTAVVMGAGFVGLEVAENLALRGLAVTVVELAPQVLSALEPEMAIRVRDALESHGVGVMTGSRVTSVDASSVDVLGENGTTESLPADLVIAAVGVRPDSSLAADAGLELGIGGGVIVDDAGRTSAPGVFAVGDVAVKRDANGAGRLIPLANLANRHGRRVADVIAGVPARLGASTGTAIVSVFGTTAAVVGANEATLRAQGRDMRVIHSHPLNHAGYYPGAESMALKLVVDPHTDAILGAQAVGGAGVDKRIDVISTAMAGGITASGLADLELAYAPAFGSAKDPVNMLGYIAQNAATGLTPSIQWHEVSAEDSVVDIRTDREHSLGAVDGAQHISLDELRTRHHELPSHRRIVVHCQVGQRGHTATRLLRELGYDAVNLDGGYLTWRDGVRSGQRVSAKSGA
jgi:NADPH-dependent 2,4-dienoyl-CoA reductase/sulfur reductase-like enzyme/rhodanese-related sulfurtransferase